MSRVTNVIVSHGFDEREAVEHLRRPIETDSRGQRLRCISGPEPGEREYDGTDWRMADGWGGTKVPEVDVWAAAFNYVADYRIIDHVAACPWKEPEYVQVFIQGQEEDRFTVYEFRDGALVAVLHGDDE